MPDGVLINQFTDPRAGKPSEGGRTQYAQNNGSGTFHRAIA